MANDLQNQGQAMVGDMQGQANQQQDKFKKKVSQVLILWKFFPKLVIFY